MKRTTRLLAGSALVCGVLAASLALTAAPAPAPEASTVIVKDRESFIPMRKYAPLPEKVIGVLVSDVAAKMSHDGRGGPADTMGFSVAEGSYRWVYVPVAKENAIISNLQVKIGEKGDRVQIYPLLNMANAKTVQQWNIGAANALVEVEVNSAQGAPAEEGFVATKMTRLDGTKEYPLNVTEVLAELRKRHATWKDEQKAKLDEAMQDAQKKAIKDRKPTGPRETQELFYVTWLPETKRLSVRFRTTITDGDYKYAGGGIERGPFPLPVPPLPDKKLPPPPGGAPGLAVFPPPPPRDFPRVRYGTSFGIEFGVAYEVNTSGKLVRTLTLPAKAFSTELPPPPVFDRPRRPIDLPPPPLPPIKN